MENLESIIQNRLNDKEAEIKAKLEKQNNILEKTKNKCEEIIKNISFLEKYGFSLSIKESLCDNYGEYYGFLRNNIIIKHNNNHFATLYPCTSGQYVVSSYQIEMSGLKFYTYETLIKAISNRI